MKTSNFAGVGSGILGFVLFGLMTNSIEFAIMSGILLGVFFKFLFLEKKDVVEREGEQ